VPGREFLVLAKELLGWGNLPRHWRAVVIHAYYAVLLECRDAMTRWSLPSLVRQQVHAQVRLRLLYSSDVELQEVGRKLERLGMDRNAASYDLRASPLFATLMGAQDAIRMAEHALSILDGIDADPIRRAAAASSIKA
jgi:hypothetical protein